MSEENQVLTLQEVVERTIKGLENLGNQKFAISPYSQNFNLWRTSLETVLSEFESNTFIKMDDQYVTECSQIFSNVESRLNEKREKEALAEKKLQNLVTSKEILREIETEYLEKIKELEREKKIKVDSTSVNSKEPKIKLDHKGGWRINLFRSFSKSIKSNQEVVSNQEFKFPEKKDKVIMEFFAAEEEKLCNEYDERKKRILEQIEKDQREVENSGFRLQEDGSLENRRTACKALTDSIRGLIERMQTIDK